MYFQFPWISFLSTLAGVAGLLLIHKWFIPAQQPWAPEPGLPLHHAGNAPAPLPVQEGLPLHHAGNAPAPLPVQEGLPLHHAGRGLPEVPDPQGLAIKIEPRRVRAEYALPPRPSSTTNNEQGNLRWFWQFLHY